MTRLWPKWYRPPGAFGPLPKVAVARRMIIFTADRLAVTPGELIGNTRKGELVAARAAIATVLKERGWSYPRIGGTLGGRDHSSIINCCRKLEFYCDRWPKIGEILRSLRFMSMGGM